MRKTESTQKPSENGQCPWGLFWTPWRSLGSQWSFFGVCGGPKWLQNRPILFRWIPYMPQNGLRENGCKKWRHLCMNSKKKHLFGKAKTSQSVVLSSQNCLFHNSTKNKNLTQDVNIKCMKIVEKSLKVTSLGCSCEVFGRFGSILNSLFFQEASGGRNICKNTSLVPQSAQKPQPPRWPSSPLLLQTSS